MAGFFGLFDYTKEGPGIPKDAPPKPRFIVFFEVLGRKFWKIVRVNLMYLLFNIPAILFMFFFSAYYLQLFTLNKLIIIEDSELFGYLFGGVIPQMIVFVCFPMISVGPAQAGMTYILRNFSREEHAFLWSDFIEHAKKNFKQSMIVGAINLIVTIFVLLDLFILVPLQMNSMLKTVVSTVTVIAYTIFMMMNMYIYPMMVTFNLTIRQLYKNAFLFAYMKLIPNFLILLVCLAVIILPFRLSLPVGYILFIFITMSLVSYITNFYVYPKLDKYMIQPARQNAEEEKTPAAE
jgi:uncharacterized membrane protein YesL